MKAIYHHRDAKPGDPIGAKASGLVALERAGFPVPPWFALSPAAFAEGARGDGPALTEGARVSLANALRAICRGNGTVAVRSSAFEEDGAEHSFAGQFRSFLAVHPDDVPQKALDVSRSGGAGRVLRYRALRGLGGSAPPPAVLVQRMIDGEISGVAFGADPVSGDPDTVVIAAIEGRGDSLVSGNAVGQTFRVDRAGAVSRDPAAGGPAAPAPASLLTDARARELAALTRRAGEHFGRPQDIEWTIAGGEVLLLQARPMTALDGAGERFIWDNSNIVESYRGITTPLTFTFARAAYEGVYRQFCRILRVPAATIAANEAVFRHMLGWIQGRIYYNLVNWHRVLAMLPGYRLNRQFMEQMMGVRENLPAAIAARIESGNPTGRFADGLRVLFSAASLLVNLVLLRARTRRFRRRLARAMLPPAVPLEKMSPPELAGHYRELERRLLTRWDAPLLNDFYCMIFYGVLRKLAGRWCPREAGLHDALLRGAGKMISAEPAARLGELAAIVHRKPAFAGVLAGGTPAEIRAGIEGFAEFAAAYAAYLEKFGERCLEELKLETPTLHDDPLPLLRAVGQMAQSNRPASPPPARAGSAEDGIARALSGRPLRRAVFGTVLRQARNRVRDRENLRFERTRVFGRVRKIFVELGRRLHEAGRLADPRDVFYLEIDEALAAAVTDSAGGDDGALRGRVARRKEEAAQFHRMPAPPNRFETRGRMDGCVAPVPIHGADEADGETARRGQGCSAGTARAPVRVVRDPREAGMKGGEIIVAEATDPGWIMLFPLAAGIVVERGSPLSHSAIVARELGIPAVVSLAGATRWLRDGEEVELDGATGIVRKIPRAAAASRRGTFEEPRPEGAAAATHTYEF